MATEAVDGTPTFDLKDEVGPRKLVNYTNLPPSVQERLVYRCALMCAQFPMLSAPEPPDGQSPSPPLPPLPATFDTGLLGSLCESDLARTAPAEVHLISSK